MKINKVLDWYAGSYYKASQGREAGRSVINATKRASGNSSLYQRIKRFITKYLAGSFYWPTTWPTSVDPPTAEFLYSLTRLLNPKTAVEIGTYKGNAAIAIGQALYDNSEESRLYTIDPVRQDIVETAIKKSGLGSVIYYKTGFSQEVIPKLSLDKIDLAFIDGDHSYVSVKKDFELVSPLVPSGGAIVFHDVLVDTEDGFDGPRKVVDEISKMSAWSVNIYPTEVGVDGDSKVVLRSKSPTFKSVGLAVCIKK